MTINDIQKKIYDLKAARASQLEAAEAAASAGDSELFEKHMGDVAASNALIAQQEQLMTQKTLYAGEPHALARAAKKTASGFGAMLKMLRGSKLDEDESQLVSKALISGTDAVSGENYLVPTDVQTAIREKRKTYLSAKELVNVVPADTLSGSTNFESGSPAGLTAFDDGDAITEETNPTFVQKKWTIGFFGKLIPVSRILAGAADGLMAYLDRWFVRNAIISENAKIFATLKNGYASGTPKEIAGWKALKKSINVDLDPSCLIGGVIVTNQSGFACLDEEEDADGRPVLQPNPMHPTEKMFQGLPIKVFPDAQLANIDSTHFPLIYGSTTSGADFMEYGGLLFDTSEHYLFNKNQVCLRVIEGFDCVSTDTDAYIYAKFSATPAAIE